MAESGGQVTDPVEVGGSMLRVLIERAGVLLLAVAAALVMFFFFLLAVGLA